LEIEWGLVANQNMDFCHFHSNKFVLSVLCIAGPWCCFSSSLFSISNFMLTSKTKQKVVGQSFKVYIYFYFFTKG